MIMLESQLKRVIKEEIQAVLFERQLHEFLTEHLTREQIERIHETGEIPEELIEGIMDWMRKKGRKFAGTAGLIAALMGPASAMAQPASSPVTTTAQAEDSTIANINVAVKNTRKQLAERFKSPQAVEAFVQFTRQSHSPAFADKSDEQVKEYYNQAIMPKLLGVVGDIPVYNTREDSANVPSKVAQKFASDPQIGGVYHTESNSIWISPQSFESTRQTDLKTITATVLEEFFHAVDGNMKAGDLFPSLAGKAQAGIQFAGSDVLARRLLGDIVKPEAQKEYVANPQEFYAKFQVIKTALREKHPEFFDAKGDVDKERLENVLSMPRMYFDEGEVDFRIFDVLKGGESDKVKQYMDQLVKVDKKAPSSQIA